LSPADKASAYPCIRLLLLLLLLLGGDNMINDAGCVAVTDAAVSTALGHVGLYINGIRTLSPYIPLDTTTFIMI